MDDVCTMCVTPRLFCRCDPDKVVEQLARDLSRWNHPAGKGRSAPAPPPAPEPRRV